MNITHFFSLGQKMRLFYRTYNAQVYGGTLVVNVIRRENPASCDCRKIIQDGGLIGG